MLRGRRIKFTDARVESERSPMVIFFIAGIRQGEALLLSL
jgi:hypothetical protein